MTGIDEATPWIKRQFGSPRFFELRNSTGDLIATALTDTEADLILNAVNSYDENRKLLRNAVLVLAGECDMATEATLLARIRAHLEAGQ